MRSWLLVHSPLLGPSSWAGVARELTALGDAVCVPDLRATLLTGPPFAGPQAQVATGGVTGEVVVVVHSAAGGLAPLIATTLSVRPAGVVFVDARLPSPGRSRLDTLPPGAADHLISMSRQGLLPPWPSWWPEEVLTELVPDRAERAVLVADSPAIPLALLEERLPSATIPDGVASSFIRLSGGYDDDAARAALLGWKVQRHDADHLTPFTGASRVAQWIIEGAVTFRAH